MGIDLLRILGDDDDPEFHRKVAWALLRYLVDPNADHGLRATVLYEILSDMSESWSVVDRAFLDSVECFPWIPGLDIEVADAGPSRFVVTIRYETAVYTIDIEARLSGASASDLPPRPLTCATVPPSTMHHRGIVSIGAPEDDVFGLRYGDTDIVHRVPWVPSRSEGASESRSVQELIAAVRNRITSGYLDGIDQSTDTLLRQFHDAIGRSFRLSKPNVAV